MRKSIILILFLFLSSDMFCQHIVQNKFFGYFFGLDKEIIKSGFNRDDIYFSEEQSSLNLYEQKFGGYSWRFVELEFYDDKFYSIYFSTPYKRKSDASELYNTLKNKLENKYKSINQYENNEEYSNGKIFYDDYNSCIITINYSESKGGDMYWYVSINYWNNSLNDERIKSNTNEL